MPKSCVSFAPRVRSARRLLTFALGFVLSIGGCKRHSDARPEAGRSEAVPVVVANVAKKDVPVEIRAVGTVEPISTVSIMPQVGGIITKVHFKEGDEVSRGDPLFTIDIRRYRANLQAAQAQLARDVALADQARTEAIRSELMSKEGVASDQEAIRMRANAVALYAALGTDRAAVENARIELGYATITAPVDGRTGSLLVHAGNVVKANDERALVVIRTLSPIYVRFSVPERFVAPVRERMQNQKLGVTVTPRGQSSGAPPIAGELFFVDSAVDAATGTIGLKARFDNAGRQLWPGEYVDAVLMLDVDRAATVVPEASVQTAQDGTYAFVIGPDQRAELRRIEVARTVDSQVVVKSGVRPGEQVVTDGQVRLRNGMRVELKSAPLTGSAAPSPSNRALERG